MVTVGLYYDVVPGKGPEFKTKFEAVVGSLSGAAGHESSFLYQRVDDPDSFAIISEWSDTGAFLAFVRSPEFHAVTAWGRSGILRNAPRHKVYPRSEDLSRPS